MKKIISTILSASMALSVFGAGISAAAGEESIGSMRSMPVTAFEGAQGGGMYAQGARAAGKTEVYHVTNLNDSGAGSFRDAVSKSGRFVVFDVSGMIDLSSNVVVKSNTTILGQTAPGDGICIRGNNVKISGSNIIVRYIRFRVGSHLADGSDTRTQDGLEVTDDSSDIIIDHCSVSWGTDENLSAYAVKDVTIQNCIIAEALNQSIHDKGEHSYAAIWGGVNLSVHHNIIATHKSRNPKIGTSETVAMTAGYTDDQTVVDLRNNIFYNWGDKAGYGAENGANVNIINNYYKPGPATPANKRARIFEFSPGNKYQPNWSGAVYANGNFIDDDGADAALVNENNWQIEKRTGVYRDANDPNYIKLEEPNSTYIGAYPINETSAQDAYTYVLENAGARLPKLDAVDSRIISDVVNGTAPTGSKGSVGLVDDPRDTVPADSAAAYDDRGYPIWVSETRASDYDTDKDGIPDAWETAVGLNPLNKNDALNIGACGRTWLEFYADNMNAEVVTGRLTAEPDTVTADEAVSFKYSGGDAELYIDGEAVSASGSEQSVTMPGTGLRTAYKCMPGAEMSNIVYVYVTDGENALSNGQSTSRTMDGDYKIVSKIEPSNLTHNIPSYIYAGDYAIGCGYDENYDKKIYCGTKGALDVSELDADNYTLFKIENVDGMVSLYAGKSLAEWVKVEEHPADDAAKIIGKAVDNGTDKTVTRFSDTYYITEESTPQIAVTSIKDGDRIGFDTEAEVMLTPGGADISQVAVYYNNQLISSVKVSVSEAQTVKIPLHFDAISAGTLKFESIDTNLCTASVETDVVISADPAPWKLADIGDAAGKTFVSVTDDYTYKINAPGGYIGGAADSCGYVYQRFTGDNRIYYRSRMQSASQFGVMLRSGLASDADMYWFGGEYNAVGTEKLTYDLKHRAKGTSESAAKYENGVVYALIDGEFTVIAAGYDESGRMTEVKTAPFKDGRAEVGTVDAYKVKLFAVDSLDTLKPVPFDLYEGEGTNGETVIDYTLDNQQPNLYFIVEKAGNTLNVYQTENGAAVYKSKTLLASIDCSNLGDTYYMGFAGTYGDGSNPPDAGWVAMDNNSGDNKYVWNMNCGLDWLWQMQESAVLKPSWTDEQVAASSGGMMKIAPDSDYSSERYIFHEYQSDDNYVASMSADVYISGDEPGLNIYFQTGTENKAYKVTLEDGMIKYNGNELNLPGGWVTIGIDTDMSADGEQGSLWFGEQGMVRDVYYPITQVTGTEFRTQINTAKKTPVTKAVYFEPIAGKNGTYYIDNVSVTAKEPSVKVTKLESWYTFTGMAEGVFSVPAEIAGTIAVNSTEPSGQTATISAGEIKGGGKTVAGISFGNKLRIKGTGKKFTVPVSKGAVVSVYGASASSSSTRPLFIDGQQYDLLAASKSDYTYNGDGSSIEIYAGDNIDVYGISVVQTTIE